MPKKEELADMLVGLRKEGLTIALIDVEPITAEVGWT